MKLTTHRWKGQGQTFRYKTFDIFFCTTLHRPPREIVLCLHGFPTASWDWHFIWPDLEQHYDIVALDFLGMGFSDKPVGHAYSIMEQADIVEALLDYLKVDHYHLLAHDYGDTVAQELLARDNIRSSQDRMIQSLCLLNGGLFPETHFARPMQKLMAGRLGPLLARFSSKDVFIKNMRAIFGMHTQPTADELDAFWQLLTENNGKLAVPGLLQYMQDRKLHRERWVQSLIDYQGPIALINGLVDPVSGAHMVSRYFELVGKGSFYPLEGIGHYPHAEAPEQVAQHYLEFLSLHRPHQASA